MDEIQKKLHEYERLYKSPYQNPPEEKKLLRLLKIKSYLLDRKLSIHNQQLHELH